MDIFVLLTIVIVAASLAVIVTMISEIPHNIKVVLATSWVVLLTLACIAETWIIILWLIMPK